MNQLDPAREAIARRVTHRYRDLWRHHWQRDDALQECRLAACSMERLDHATTNARYRLIDAIDAYARMGRRRPRGRNATVIAIGDVWELPHQSVASCAAAVERRDEVQALLRVLTDRQRDVVARYYGLGRPQESMVAIGASLERTVSTVSMIHARAIRRMSEVACGQ